MSADVLDELGLGVVYTTHKVFLTDPKTGGPLIDNETNEQAFVEIDGLNSDAGEKIQKAWRLRAQRKGQRQQVDLDRDRAENAENLALVTKSWLLVNRDTGATIPAEKFPCNFGNAKMLYGREATEWIAHQVGAAFLEASNFIKD